jgi:hypothetical protein
MTKVEREIIRALIRGLMQTVSQLRRLLEQYPDAEKINNT